MFAGELAAQLDAAGGGDGSDLEKTALAKSVRYFEKGFLDPLLKSLHKAARDEKEQVAAVMGDF